MFLFCSSFRIDLLILFIDLLDIFPSITKLPYWSREGSEPVLHQHLKPPLIRAPPSQSPHAWDSDVLSPAPTYLPTYTRNKSRSAHNAAHGY